MLQCPVCRARLEQGPQCRRCRADLSLLFALNDQRRKALASARSFAADGRWEAALVVAEGADTLRRGEESQQLIALVHLARRDFRGAWETYVGARQRERAQDG